MRRLWLTRSLISPNSQQLLYFFWQYSVGFTYQWTPLCITKKRWIFYNFRFILYIIQFAKIFTKLYCRCSLYWRNRLDHSTAIYYKIRSSHNRHHLILSIHFTDVIMNGKASQITSLTIVYATVYSRRRSKKTPMLRITGLCEGIHRWPVNSPHKWPVTRKMFSFDDVILIS